LTRRLKTAVSVRGDCLYCPLPLAVDSYWNCLTDCHHCYFRRLNRTWGTDLRPADPEAIRRKLVAGLANKNPKSSLAHALRLKKTIRLGNKTDPYQDAEREWRVSRGVQRALIDLDWSYVIQTRFLHNLLDDMDLLREASDCNLVTIMPVISPGAEKDHSLLERGRTTPIPRRLRIIKRFLRRGWIVGVNGEPFIPGHHTTDQFRSIVRRLVEVGVQSYNTYNFHWNDYVAKRLHEIGLDIERIWYYNRDEHWRPILKKLMEIADEEGINLSCPDFVNTGWGWKDRANTCCGINVPNPTWFNSHHFKQLMQEGHQPADIDLECWEGIGDRETGMKILRGEKCDLYTMGDVVD